MSRTERFSRSASRRELVKAGLCGVMGIANALVPALRSFGQSIPKRRLSKNL